MPPRTTLVRFATAWLLAAVLTACASAGGARATDDAEAPAAVAPPPASTALVADIGEYAGPPAGETVSAAASPPPDAAANATPTQAEDDFAAIYGGTAESNAASGGRSPLDPWEPFNRHVHHFNNGVDRYVAKPLARGYIAIAPPPVRLGIGNFFSNLGQPVSAVNALLQGHPKQAGQSLARFTLNFTFGVLGFFDPATHLGLPNRSEDFGQTLARWGWTRSRYLELPFLGPRTLRDAFGGAVEAPLSPLGQIEEDRVRVFLQGLQLVDLRTNLLVADSMRSGAYDDYTLTRDAWLQRRNYQIDANNGDAGGALPSYLQDDPATPDPTTPDPDTPAPQPAQ